MIKATIKQDGEKIKKIKGDNVIIVSLDDTEADGIIAGDPEILMEGISAIVKELVNNML